MIKAATPYFLAKDKKAIMAEFQDILSSGRLIFGQYTNRFEKEFSLFHGCKYAVAVNSCSAALEIVLRFVGVKGYEVIVPTNTFVATAFSVIRAGGNLVLADIEDQYYSLSLESLKAKMSLRTKAVVLVHVGGYISSNLDQIRRLCKERSVALIEDAAHAHGASVKNKFTGTFSLAGCFSFYPTKIMTSGVGGALLTNNEKLFAYAKSLRHFGQGKDLGDIRHEGNDWLMDEFRAVIAYHQLKALPENLVKRRRISEWYAEKLGRIKGINIPEIKVTHKPSYYRYFIELDNKLDKLQILKRLREEFKIEAGTLYDPPVHRQPFFKKTYNFNDADFKNTDRLLSGQIALPMHPGISHDDVGSIEDAFKRILT